MKMIEKFEHVCSNCSTKFHAASLGDFCYGEFLLWSSAQDCLYLNAFEDEAYQELIALVEKNKQNGIIKVSDSSLLLQEIYGELTCDLDGHGRPFHMNYTPCPNCGSTKMALVGDRAGEQAAVGMVTHEVWNSLTLKEKEDRLIEMLISREKAIDSAALSISSQ